MESEIIPLNNQPARGLALTNPNAILAATVPHWAIEAEPWPEPIDAKLLLDELTRVFNNWVVLPKFAPEACALFTLHTYAYHLREVTAYLGIESPLKRCGKSTLLAVLSAVVNRPVVSSNISPPAFFRVIEEARPTLLIDEADTLLKGNDELRGILNSGYTRSTAFVVRVANQAGQNGEPVPAVASEDLRADAKTVEAPAVKPGLIAILLLVPESHGLDRAFAGHLGRPMHCHPNAAQDSTGAV